MKPAIMTDYIKREDAINAFDDPRVESNYGDVSPSSVIDVIKTIQAADVRENVRGEWIPIDELPWDEANTFLCSHCHSECDTHNGDYDLPYFCPNCGADMRGENDG